MPEQCRISDLSKAPVDAHGCPICPHPNPQGPAIKGSPNVNVDKLPALRVTDKGIHVACCGTNTWTAAAGSGTVMINNLQAHRKGDLDNHCGGVGTMQTGSGTVTTGG